MPKLAGTDRRRPDTGLLGTLRAATRDQHRAVERELNLPHRISSTADFAVVLAALLAAWLPIERYLASCDWSVLGLEPRLGEAVHLLREDLARLDPVGGSPAAVVVALSDQPAHAVGARYVLLGSAMGGRIIAPLVEQRLGPGVGSCMFFRRAGLDPGRDWRTFQAAVATVRWSPSDVGAAVHAARHTFDLIRTAARSTFATIGPAEPESTP